MRIRMNTDRQAAPDGIRVVDLLAGEEYDVRRELGRSYVERGLAELVDDEPEHDEPEELETETPAGLEHEEPAQLEGDPPPIDLETAKYGEKLSYYNDHLRGDAEPLRWGTSKKKLNAAIADARRES